MKVHRLAKYFPELEGEEFDLLVEDIRQHGQYEPIVLVGDEILDGVNRWKACKKLDIEPTTKQYSGDDPLSYVISENIRRRHMDVSQRAMLATEMLPEFEKQAKERKEKTRDKDTGKFEPGRSPDQPGDWRGKHFARDDAARVFGVSGPSIQRAKRIKQEAPEKVADIIKGKATIGAVDAEIRAEDAAERAQKQQAKQTDKSVKETPKIVKDYFEAVKQFRKVLVIAVAAAKQGRFSPESKNMVLGKNEEVRDLMQELEESI